MLDSEFEVWWESYWKCKSPTAVMDLAFKEVAKKAWDAGIAQEQVRQAIPDPYES